MVGWEASARHMSRIFIRGLPPIPSISTLLAADPCRAASPTDVASIVPGQFASRRGDHQRSLSPANRIRQRAESFPSNRSPPQRKSVENLPFRFDLADNISYYFTRRFSIFIPNYFGFLREYFSFGATVRSSSFSFFFHAGTVLEITRVAIRFALEATRHQHSTERRGAVPFREKVGTKRAARAPRILDRVTQCGCRPGTGRDGSVYERVCHGNTVADTTPTLPSAAGQHQTSVDAGPSPRQRRPLSLTRSVLRHSLS